MSLTEGTSEQREHDPYRSSATAPGDANGSTPCAVWPAIANARADSLDEARRIIHEAETRRVGNMVFHAARYGLAFLRTTAAALPWLQNPFQQVPAQWRQHRKAARRLPDRLRLDPVLSLRFIDLRHRAPLGEAISQLRGELGESLAIVKRFDVPLAQATTSSLEALKASGGVSEIALITASDDAWLFVENLAE